MPDGTQTTKTLRVLALGTNWFPPVSGGLERVYSELMRALPNIGIDATGLVFGPPDVAARTGGRVSAFGRPGDTMPGRLWRARIQTGALVDSGQFDVIASHFAMFTFPALGRLRNIPLAVHFHGPWADEAYHEGGGTISVTVKRAVERAVYRRAERVIVLSRAFGVIARDQYGVPEDRLRYVPGMVDLKRFDLTVGRTEARAQLGLPQDRRLILSVRRLAQRMGLDRLIDAMAKVVQTHRDALLLIAGDGHMGKVLRNQVSELGLTQHIRFLGFVSEDQLPLLYRAAELNVVPTLALEGFGLTTVEALASGTPSIVAPVGGLPEVVGDLSHDLIFCSSSAEDIADRLKMVLGGQLDLPEEKMCRDYVEARYSVKHAASAVAAVYREML
jgi:glycosyltransferase involved in cell wall biosynthesis